MRTNIKRSEILLHNLKRGDKFKVDPDVLTHNEPQHTYTFDHTDGMYSVCYTEGGQLAHWAVYTPVIQVKGGDHE